MLATYVSKPNVPFLKIPSGWRLLTLIIVNNSVSDQVFPLSLLIYDLQAED